MRSVKISFFFGLFCLSHFSFASKDIDVFSDKSRKLSIVKSIEVYVDTSSELSFKEVLLLNQFKSFGNKVPNLGVSQNSFWVKFTIQNVTDINSLYLEIDNSLIDEVDFYTIKSDGKVLIEKTGEAFGISERNYRDQNFVFRINIPQNNIQTYYLRVRSGDLIVLPIYLSIPQAFIESQLERELIFGIYAGIIVVMFLYNLFLFFTIRDKNYLYYVFYIFGVGSAQIALQGFSYKYLWPNSPWFVNQSLILFAALSGISIVLFLRHFLQTKKYTPVLNKGLNVIIVAYSIAVPLRLLGYNNLSYSIVDLLAGIVCFYSLLVAIIISVKGYRPAKFFLLAWSILLVGMFSFVLRNFGLLPYNNFTNYSMPIGNALEVILLSFALADRINILKKEKEQSQLQALEALQENDRIIREQNVVLEAKVDARTSALKKSNTDLNATLKNLKEAQSQLVNAEKMASLGQLTAGVAHEINNPINFVSSSIKPLRRDIGDILGILSKYEEVNESNVLEKVKEINDLKSALDLDYVKEEIDSLIKGIDEGASRTAEIVKGLKTFSRLDEMDLKRVDLNEGIDSTLILLSSLMMGKIQVVKEYGTIPKVECFAGRLNQVFMNLLNNAIHAVLKKGVNEGEGIITIKTMEKDDEVIISIADNGTGIPDKIRYKIFDPFFTTKDVGEGTGLGLSIVYNIIETHKGKIEVESEMGKGTEFIISLPKLQNS